MKKLVSILIVLTILFNASVLTAREKSNPSDTVQKTVQDTLATTDNLLGFQGNNGPNFGMLLFKTIGSLIIIFILIFIVVYYFKKFIIGKKGAGGNAGSMQIVGNLYLAPKKSLYLVKIGKKIVVLGVTENNISRISELDEEEFEELKAMESSDSHSMLTQQFNGILNKLMKKEKVLK